ncbi:MarR family winged helix-turn-helix transcriptional regulator [Listeria costaricensis]|uniref:MarR family winged helix-turn-helix transcriptional regulator n=1 Tax=Listeria costaricensis TaxID=2026604 RepID=UPI000C0870E7|nr:MarR family winged helix-turn-helix transcriptional regulator [Listeria costaricensis]
MDNKLEHGAEAVSLFCRLNINTKKNLPVRSGEMGLLIYICKTEVAVTSVMAADFFKVKKPLIAAQVASLSKAGYLEKVPSQTDKRSFILRPTSKAKTLVEETFTEYLSTMSHLATKLGNDFETLIILLDKANKILLEERENG